MKSASGTSKGVCPTAQMIPAISAMAMLLEQAGQTNASQRVYQAIETVTGTKMKSQAAGKMGYGTTEIGDLVCEAL